MDIPGCFEANCTRCPPTNFFQMSGRVGKRPRLSTQGVEEVKNLVFKTVQDLFHKDEPSAGELAQYRNVRNVSMLMILAISVYKCPKYFFASTVLGLLAEIGVRSQKIEGWETLSTKIKPKEQLQASGCLDIVPKVFELAVDPKISLVFASIMFCCHIVHSHKVMMQSSTAYVGMLSGFASYHFLPNNRYID